MSYIEITKDNFEEKVLKNEQTVLLDFWATWCGPCRMVAPIIEEIADEYDEITVGKVNVDEQPELAGAFSITSIPTLVVVKEGKIAAQAVGYRPKEDIVKLLEI